ncbi:unnamed protein product [Adineta ricciae]|uniref:Rho-GAP domain-containing protein n=1 Tax=Adineta ricciae TaxID=249248 RepID=A0A814FEV6_ADIRI|nr:unnamed protein product [Adineta ricciae]
MASTNPLMRMSAMNKLKPFFNGAKNEDAPECYERVRYIRDSCKALSDIWKSDKDILNKSIEGEVAKTLKEFRVSENARAYYSPHGATGSPSILNATVEDLIMIHETIDEDRRRWLEKFRKIAEQAKEKQSSIRQTMADLRDNYDRALKKFETAEANLKKFRNRSDRSTVQNYDDRCRELEDIRSECDQARILARDAYATETYRIASEEHSISRDLFAQILSEEQTFYRDIEQYLSKEIPRIRGRLDADQLTPCFHCDLAEHCTKHIGRPIAYPIETCIHLLRGSETEEGLFRIAPAHGKQKKLVAELDLQLLNKHSRLNVLGYDAHVAAGTLKQYLRELPDCLLTDKLLSQWIEVPTLSTDEARIQRIGELISQLPKVNYDNLCYLIRFLSDVAAKSAENKMTAGNLGICIGCSILYAKDQPSIPMMSNSYTQSSTIVELMIVHHKKLFPSNEKMELRTQIEPDIIPKGRPTENSSVPEGDLLNIETSEPSPPQSRKSQAPRAPSVRQAFIQAESTQNPRTEGDHLSAKQQSAESITAPSSPGLNRHTRNPSCDSELDRSFVPPPVPPPLRPRPSISRKELERSDSTSSDASFLSPTSNDGVQTSKSTSDMHNRANNSGPPTNLRLSSHRKPTSPEEITQF